MNLFINRSSSRSLILLISLLLTVCLSAAAQESAFNKALSLYETDDFAKAARTFDRIHSNRALLFAGKSYYNLGDYATAKDRLLKVQERDDSQLYGEAGYTLSLIHIKNADFNDALSQLRALKKMKAYTALSIDSKQLYNNILNYLNFEQRLEIMKKSQRDSLLYDLSRTAMGRVDYEDAQVLFTRMKKSVDNIASAQIDSLSRLLEDKSAYAALKERTKVEPLLGRSYNIGIGLPAFSENQREYQIARGLYQGAMLAAEQFNADHETQINFFFQNTGTKADSAQQALEAFKRLDVDAVIGPLFSKQARTMAHVADQFQKPIIAPLANAQGIAEKGGFIYQVNPTFKVHGKVMARFADELLENNKTAVLAQNNTVGELSAEAFRSETKKLGGMVSDYFVENMGPDGYQLSTYVRYITEKTDTSAVSAIYAPFAGSNAPTLIDLLLRQLNTLESNIPVLGLPEWSNVNIDAENLANRNIYFTESFYTKPSNYKIDRFKAAYRQRFDETPNRFAMIGYDTGSFLFRALDEVANPDLLQEQLPEAPLYEGIITDIHFDGGNINQELMVFKITPNGVRLVSN